MANIYFDHNATTALDSRALAAMLPWMQTQTGNPTSRHVAGRAARDAIEYARTQVAEACGAYSAQVTFTASGTESNNFAVKGMAQHVGNGQILTSSIEHPCVTKPAFSMQTLGYQHRTINVDNNGNIDVEQYKTLLTTPTSLVSVMLANNETGVIQNIAQVAELARQARALVHTDAVQGVCKIPLSFTDLNVHAMTVSSHKIGGPQGAAALILDKRVDISPLLHGGGQEKGLRSGTENVAAIVGFGMACEIGMANLADYAQHTSQLRDAFEQGLKALAAQFNLVIFGQAATRLPNTSFFAIADIEGETLVMALDRKGFGVASGSACSSDSTEPSHVLLAMGIHPDLARGAVRVSFGKSNSMAEVERFLTVLRDEVLRLKQLTAIAA